MNYQINKYRGFILLAFFFLMIMDAANSFVQAQEQILTFQENGELLLHGTPNGIVTAPLTIVAGETAVTNITFSLDFLIDPDQPNEALSGTVAVFSPNSFDLPANTTRTVLLSIPTAPDRPGIYQGKLQVRFGAGDILSRTVRLHVAYAALDLATAAEPLEIYGGIGNLQQTLWLASPFGDGKGITLVAEPLHNAGNREVIHPSQVLLREGNIDLRRGDRRLITISITGENILPGTYTGHVYFVQQNQRLDEASKLNLVVTVLGAPSISLPQGGTVVAQLIRPQSSPNELFARWLMPADYRQDSLTVQIQNDGLDTVQLTSVQKAITRYGPINASSTANILHTMTPTMTIPVGETGLVKLQIPEEGVLPGTYKGTVTMLLTDTSGSQRSQIKQTIQLDVNVREGPAWALLLIFLGIMFGRVVNVTKSEQVRLLGSYYKLANRANRLKASSPATYHPDWARIQNDGEIIRNAIYMGEDTSLARQLELWQKKQDQLKTYSDNYPQLQKAFKDKKLSTEDVGLVEAAADNLRRRIHTDDDLDIKTELSNLIQAVPSLPRLRKLEQDVAATDDLNEEDLTFFGRQVEKIRSELLTGKLERAQGNFDNLAQAMKILPEIAKIEKEAKIILAKKPQEYSLVEWELKIVRRQVSLFQFEQVFQRLLDIRTALIVQSKPEEKIQPMDGTDLIEGQAEDLGELRLTHGASFLRNMADSLIRRFDDWQPSTFIDRQSPLVQMIPIPAESRWRQFVKWFRLRLEGLIINLRLELGLRLGRPLVWSVTVVLLVLTGFQTLYVAQGTTFGANPMTDYLVLFLWGLTSDVSGATVSSLADKWLTKNN